MAKAAGLIKGFKYEVERGILLGHVVTIVDNVTFPDGHEYARKVTIKMEDGSIEYILPKLIGEDPVGIENPAMVSVDSYIVPKSAPVEATVSIPVGDADVSLALGSEVPMVVDGVTKMVSKVIPITDPMDPRLDHLRPSKKKIKRYFNRIMPNGMTDVEFLLMFTTDAYRVENEMRPANIMLKGDTQSGKTFMVEVLAVKWSEMLGLPKPMPIFTLSGSAGVTDFDLFGQVTSYTDPETGESRLVDLPGIASMAAQCGGIFYLDEVNAMAERVTSSLHPLADHRHQFTNRNKAVMKGGQIMPEVIKAHDDLWIIGTYNEGYAGMGKMNEAFQNRFRHIRWGYDDAVEAKLIDSPTVRVIGQALRLARKENSRGIRTPVGTAALERLERDVITFGVEAGLEIFYGMFSASEADVVETIIKDRTFDAQLEQEAVQRQMDSAPEPDDGDIAAANDLLDMLSVPLTNN